MSYATQGLFIIQYSYIQVSVITLTPTLSLRERGLLTDLFPENEKTLYARQGNIDSQATFRLPFPYSQSRRQTVEK